MRVVRVFVDGDARYGLADDDTVTLISDEPFAAWEPDGTFPLSEVTLLAPVVPTKVVCVGLNYRSHAEEMDVPLPEEPVIFLKPPTSVVGPEADVVLPPAAGRVDHEAELAVVIGRRTHNVEREDADRFILGYTCANDITARDLQARDGQWTRAKAFDTFCPIGPWVDTDFDPADATLTCMVDGHLRQQGATGDMVFDCQELVSFVSKVMTLLPGDVLLTGTPSGIGPVRPGERVEVSVEGLGLLSNPVSGG